MDMIFYLVKLPTLIQTAGLLQCVSYNHWKSDFDMILNKQRKKITPESSFTFNPYYSIYNVSFLGQPIMWHSMKQSMLLIIYSAFNMCSMWRMWKSSGALELVAIKCTIVSLHGEPLYWRQCAAQTPLHTQNTRPPVSHLVILKQHSLLSTTNASPTRPSNSFQTELRVLASTVLARPVCFWPTLT